MSKEGYDEIYGARPLKRVIQNQILDELSLQIVECRVKEGDKVEADIKDGEITIKTKR